MNYSINQSVTEELTGTQNSNTSMGFFGLIHYRARYFWNYIWDIIDVKISQHQFRAGKGKILRSFSDLDRD